MSVLELAGVDAFYGHSHVLFDLSMQIEQNEVVALLGRNGAGKTTTLRAITGTVPRREGHIVFRDQEMSTGRSTPSATWASSSSPRSDGYPSP